MLQKILRKVQFSGCHYFAKISFSLKIDLFSSLEVDFCKSLFSSLPRSSSDLIFCFLCITGLASRWSIFWENALPLIATKWAVRLFSFLSLFLSFFLSFSLSLSLSLSFFLSFFPSFSLSFFLSLPLSFFLSISLSSSRLSLYRYHTHIATLNDQLSLFRNFLQQTT